MAQPPKQKRNWKKLFCLPAGKDNLLHYTVLVLVLFGSFMIISTNVGNTSSDSMVVVRVFIKQLGFLILGYILMLITAKLFHFKRIYQMSRIMVVLLLILMIIPLFGIETFGSQAWIRFSLFGMQLSLQPSEFTKPFMIILIATNFYAAQHKPRMQQSWWDMLRWPIVCYILFTIVILIQKDIGSFAILTLICIGCVQIPNFPIIRTFQKWSRRMVAIGVAVVVFGMTPVGLKIVTHISESSSFLSHIAARFQNAADPLAGGLYQDSYQPMNALYGIANSNIFGRGIGESSRKFGYLTQADSDYILAIIIEETGIIGLSIITVGYGLILFRLFKYAFRTNYMPYKVILSGTGVYLFAHFLLNVGGVGALLPMTGIPLLFISNGGSALMSVFIAIGACQYVIAQIRRREMEQTRSRQPRVSNG